MLTEEDRHRFEETVKRLFREKAEPRVIVSKQDLTLDSRSFYDGLKFQSSGCGVGETFCHIEPDGRVIPCVTLGRLGNGNLKTRPFAELWERLSAEIRQMKGSGDCTLCKVHEAAGRLEH
jgi:MoaA/NifB/PqqE/SkfB family radical SAM enzyme